MSVLKRVLTEGAYRHTTVLGLSLGGLVLSFFDVAIYGVDPAWVAVILCGAPIVWVAMKALVTRFDVKAGLLVTIALAACLYLDEVFAAGEVAFIMMLGELLEDRTVAKARAGVEKLVRLTPRTARLVCGSTERVIDALAVRPGDVLRVLPGETIPVDGLVLSGAGAVDQSILTGESLPVDKAPGDDLLGGTLNQFGAIEMRATRVGDDTAFGRMVRLVESGDASKARIVRLMDRWATWIVLGALFAAAGTWIITGEVIRAAAVLVVFCPCSLVLATPTAIVAGIGNLTRYGVLVRSGDALERLSAVTRIAFDKTGTLTCGRPEVIKVRSFDPSLNEMALLRLVAGAERNSEHPLGRAIVRYARANGVSAPEPSDFAMQPGWGVAATVDGYKVLVGKQDLIASRGLDASAIADGLTKSAAPLGATRAFIAVDGRVVGQVSFADKLREDGETAVSRLKALGLTPMLLTGDAPGPARAVASAVGVDDVRAGCLPETKLAFVRDLAAQGQPVVMLGDGVNDAPALKAAHVGVAMGGVGSDVAVEAADIVLVRDDLRFVPHMIALSRRMMTMIRLNIALSLGLNFVGVILAMAGVLNPFWAAIVHNAGSIVVVSLSATLLRWRTYPENPPALHEARSASSRSDHDARTLGPAPSASVRSSA